MFLTAETGQDAKGHLFLHIDHLAAGAGLANWVVVPGDLCDQAVTTFDWET